MEVSRALVAVEQGVEVEQKHRHREHHSHALNPELEVVPVGQRVEILGCLAKHVLDDHAKPAKDKDTCQRVEMAIRALYTWPSEHCIAAQAVSANRGLGRAESAACDGE